VTAFRLLYDPAEERIVQDRILPLFQGHEVEARPLTTAPAFAQDDPTVLVTYLNDTALTSLVPQAVAGGWRLGLLPHPDMKQARMGFGISARIEEAVTNILSTQEPKPLDLLCCNGRPVFNSVSIGNPYMLSPGIGLPEGRRQRLRRFVHLVRSLRTITVRPFKLTTHMGKTLDTAALGIVIVQHGRSSVLTRRMLEDSAVNDGMLHTLVLAPRSVGEMIRLLFSSVLLRGSARGGGALPESVGHIKARTVTIAGAEPIDYSVDGVPHSARVLECEVSMRVLNLIPGRLLEVDQAGPEAKERFRVEGLPTGEALGAMAASPLPWIKHATADEFKDLFLVLRENSRFSESYWILTVLSTLLATFGLFADSSPVIIGAMILAPFMAPIVSLAMGVLRLEKPLITACTQTLAWGILLALASSMVLAWLTPLRTVNSEIAARLSPTLLDLGVAVIAGIAGAYAHARAEVARSLAGVAIAVALVPPLAVSGIGIGWADGSVFWGAFLLFLTNLAGIVLAAAMTFLLLGFSPFRRARRGLAFSLLLVGAVSIPLALGFARMVDEHHIIRTLDGWKTEGVVVRDIGVRGGKPLHLSVKLLSDAPIEADRIDRVKREIETVLGREVLLEASTAMVR